jgi:hypothetical protein
MAKHMATDQISFYDESLKKQIEGSYSTDGKAIHVRSVKYGIKSAPYGHWHVRRSGWAGFVSAKAIERVGA